MESSFQVDVLGGDGSDVGLGVELMETEDQEAEVTLPAQVTTSPVLASAADTGAVVAPNMEEEETEKKPGAKRGRKATASVEEKREGEAPELAVPEPEVSSSTR